MSDVPGRSDECASVSPNTPEESRNTPEGMHWFVDQYIISIIRLACDKVSEQVYEENKEQVERIARIIMSQRLSYWLRRIEE